MNDVIHAAVRRDLTRMQEALRAFPDGDGTRARDLERAWDALWAQLHHHHEGEDAHVFPYVRSLGEVDASLLDEMESEHQAMSDAMQRAGAAVAGLAASPQRDRAVRAADAVAAAYDVTDRHLVHEETAVVPVIDAHKNSPEWKAVEKKLRVGGPRLAGDMFAWMQDGASPEVLQAIRETVPAPVLFVLTRVLGRRYHREIAPIWQ